MQTVGHYLLGGLLPLPGPDGLPVLLGKFGLAPPPPLPPFAAIVRMFMCHLLLDLIYVSSHVLGRSVEGLHLRHLRPRSEISTTYPTPTTSVVLAKAGTHGRAPPVIPDSDRGPL